MSFSEIDRPQYVWDEKGVKYELLKELSRGSQGVTYLTNKQNTLIKLAFNQNDNENQKSEFITNLDEIGSYYKRLRYLRSLPIPKNTKLTPPESFLQKLAGYKMTYLGGMESFFDNFIAISQLETNKEDKGINQKESLKIPSFFIKKSNYEKLDAKSRKKIDKRYLIIKKYLNSGGLKRKLIALGNAASILSQLHYNGLVYGDISLNNTFISKDINETNVWFIDLDNIYEDVDKDVDNEWSLIIGTPGTMAPELYTGEVACSMRSDDYGFAMLAFKLITNIYPFHGKAYNSIPFDSVPTKDDLAESGQFPWIFDPEDNSNENKCFVDREYLISKELMRLFWEMFVNGKADINFRPPIHLWTREFFKEADNLSFCNNPECGMSFIDKNNECPLCKSKKLKDELVVYTKSEGSDKIFWINRYPLKNKGKTSDLHLFKRSVVPFNVSDFNSVILNMEISSEGLVIRKDKFCDISLYYLDKEGRKIELLPGKTTIGIDEISNFKILVQLETPRVISFQLNSRN